MRSGKIKLVIFDLDGTLADIPIEWTSLDNDLERKFKMRVHPYSEVIPNLPGSVRKEIFQIYGKYELKSLPHIMPNHKALKYLHFCQSKGILTALVTLQGRDFVKRFNSQFDLTFDEIVTREDSFNRTEQLSIVLSRTNISPEHTVFVGNTQQDMVSAKEVRCTFIDVTTLK